MFFPKIVSKLRSEPLSFLQYKDNAFFWIFQISRELFFIFFVPWNFVSRGRQLFCQSLGVGVIYHLLCEMETKGDFINPSRSIRHPPVRTFLQGFICLIIGLEIPGHLGTAFINSILNEINLIHSYLISVTVVSPYV